MKIMAAAASSVKTTPCQSFSVMALTSIPRYPSILPMSVANVIRVAIVNAFLEFDHRAQHLQIGNESIQFGFTFHGFGSATDIRISVRCRIEWHLAHHYHGVNQPLRINHILFQEEK